MTPKRLTSTIQRLAWVVAALVCMTSCMSMGQAPSGKDALRLQLSPQFHQGVFVNQAPEPDTDTSGIWTRLLEAERVAPTGPIPLDSYTAQDAPAPSELQVTWVGHSTMLIEFDGVRILTDPIWSDRASPLSGVGPQRFHAPGISWDALPPIDAVVISHDHYDHLDMGTVMRLAETGVRFVVPLGVGSHLRAWSVVNITELDWWQHVTLSTRDGRSINLVATPAQHFSGRKGFDRNATLWASWAFIGPNHRVYFGGDTGYSPAFSTIGQMLGPFDVTLMPIGAYDQAWPFVHLDPEEAVQAHIELKGQTFVPIHWGTFTLAFHAWDAPVEWLLAEAAERQVRLAIPRPGQTVVLRGDGSPAERVDPWWREVDRTAPTLAVDR